ncbi:MAG: hypothetical protein EBW68_06810 [Actinobacteria bacterium]|nr:hypothetical protein [Actinomycetota bacterium]
MLVVSETSRSWVCHSGCKAVKVPKTGERRGFALSQEEVDAAVWMHDNRWKLADKIRALTNYELLKKVAEIVGYTEDGK